MTIASSIRRATCICCGLGALITGMATVHADGAEDGRLSFSFDRDQRGLSLAQQGEGPGPVVTDGQLQLLSGVASERNSAAFDVTASGPHQRIEADFTMHILPGADGGAFALLPTDQFGAKGPAPEVEEWEEPNLPDTLAVGFDVYNPPGGNAFDERGNISDHPQREISLHWDGMEVANRMSPVEFRGEGWHSVGIVVEFVIGGANVTVTLDAAPVYDAYFIPEALPYESRVAFGARTGGETTVLAIDDLDVQFLEPVDTVVEPIRITALDGVILHGGQREFEQIAALPQLTEPVGRIIGTLTLDAPPGGFDPWDRSAAVYAWDDSGERIEIIRYITPYGRGHTWRVDLTDYASILRGETRVGVFTDTWLGATTPEEQQGWKVSLDLAYYEARASEEAFLVRNLWSGNPEYGDPEHPLEDFFTPRSGQIPRAATRVKLRLMVTGHGQHPASENAAEFMPADRTLIVNGQEFANTLWKDDCYLNPCRPQGGTWKFERAGWAPGDVVTPWEIDITECVTAGEAAAISYTPMDYVNENRDQAQAHHWVEAQLICYRSTH